MKSYLDLREGDFITPTVVIEPLKKCLTVGNLYQIVKFGFNHKGVRKQFYIQDDNGNIKHYNLNTFHRRWQAVEPTQTEAKPTREAWGKNIDTNDLQSKNDMQQVLHKAHVTRWQAFKEQKPDAGQWFVARLSSGEFIPVLIWGEPLAYWFDEDDLWFPVPAIG